RWATRVGAFQGGETCNKSNRTTRIARHKSRASRTIKTALADAARVTKTGGETEMPGTVIELTIDDALAVVLAVERDPQLLLWKHTIAEQHALLTEARRVIDQRAHEVAERCSPPLSDRPILRLVKLHERSGK